jgi:hypothetical protein
MSESRDEKTAAPDGRDGAPSSEPPPGDAQLALALCRALMICLVKMDDRFVSELSESLTEVAEKLKDEKGAGARQVVSNLETFSRSLGVDPRAMVSEARGRMH